MFCLQAATINSVTAIDPHVISQYVNNFARGMQEENNNRLVAGGHLATYLASYHQKIFQVYENGCNLQTLCSLW